MRAHLPKAPTASAASDVYAQCACVKLGCTVHIAERARLVRGSVRSPPQSHPKYVELSCSGCITWPSCSCRPCPCLPWFCHRRNPFSPAAGRVRERVRNGCVRPSASERAVHSCRPLMGGSPRRDSIRRLGWGLESCFESRALTDARLVLEVAAGWSIPSSRGLWGGDGLLISTTLLETRERVVTCSRDTEVIWPATIATCASTVLHGSVGLASERAASASSTLPSRADFSFRDDHHCTKLLHPPTSFTLESPEALVPSRDSPGSHRAAARVATRKTQPRRVLRPRSDRMRQPSYHSTPTCARAPSIVYRCVPPSGCTP